MRVIPRKPAREQNPTPGRSDIPKEALPLSLNDKIAILEPFLDKNEDIIKRDFLIGKELEIEARAIYLNQVVNTELLNQHILEPLMLYEPPHTETIYYLAKMLAKSGPSVGQLSTALNLNEVVHHIFDGRVVILLDGQHELLVIDIFGGEFRAVDEPPGERTSRGPREGFIENLDVNISMIRRRLRDPRLVVKKTRVGRRTRTPVAILYIEDIASPQVVQQVQERLDAIDVDGISAVGYLEQFMEKSPWSFFPQFWHSERPDRVAMKLLEGKVILVIHGSPLAMTVPTLALEFFQASEDYYERTLYASFIRFMRFVAFFLAVSLPAIYVALFSFHPELVPFRLLIPVAQARAQVPFPVLIEVLIQEFIIQMVVESGLRVPGSIGQAVGVVTGIILGQAAIAAKLASPGVIIVIAVTTILTFVMPSSGMVLASRVLRLPLILICGLFGMFGFSLAWLFIVIHLSSLQDFGAPYYAPFAPLRWQDIKDSAIRFPLWKMKRRSFSYPVGDQTRQGKTAPDKEGRA